MRPRRLQGSSSQLAHMWYDPIKSILGVLDDRILGYGIVLQEQCGWDTSRRLSIRSIRSSTL